jgi:hypothetical protein
LRLTSRKSRSITSAASSEGQPDVKSKAGMVRADFPLNQPAGK